MIRAESGLPLMILQPNSRGETGILMPERMAIQSKAPISMKSQKRELEKRRVR
jgi:hypothetical protein